MHDYDFLIKKYRADNGDVPLQNALFMWNSPADQKECRIVVVDYTKYKGELPFFSMCHGACWEYWRKLEPEKLLSELFIEGYHLICREGIPVEKIHEAFCVVPEYRNSLASDFRILKPEDVLDAMLGQG